MVTFVSGCADLSCVIGNLFAVLEPPCDGVPDDRLVLCGSTFSGDGGRLELVPEKDGFVCRFSGNEKDLEMALKRPCMERKCGIG